MMVDMMLSAVWTRTVRWVVAAGVVALAACGNGAGDDAEIPPGATLVVTPASAQLDVVNGAPATQAFRLPFQDLASNDHVAQWTETVVPIGKLRPTTPR